MVRVKNPLHAKVLQHVRRKISRRGLIISTGIILVIFVAANIVTFVAYRNRLYPNSGVGGWQLGNRDYNYVSNQKLVPEQIYLKTDYDHETLQTKDLGARLNWEATKIGIAKRKPWLPIVGLLGHKDYDLVIDYNEADITKASSDISKRFTRPATDWSIDKSGSEPKLVTGKDGYDVDQVKLKELMHLTVANGYLLVPVKKVSPKISDKDLVPLVTQLKAKQSVSLRFSYNSSSKTASPTDILSWYDISDSTISLAKDRVTSFVSTTASNWGIRAQNQDQLVTDIINSLTKQTKLTATVIAAPKATKKYTFCVRARNVSESELPGFAAKILSVLNDPRGWSLDGQVSFTQATSGCNMVAWLSAAEDMPSFGAICDSLWSCTVRPNVIINYNRWTGASDAWNASGGNLDDYRTMVINHESGHWLGFGHRYCGGAGQQAPVMQQQSISLQGCTFNPWPVDAEKDLLKAMLGL